MLDIFSSFHHELERSAINLCLYASIEKGVGEEDIGPPYNGCKSALSGPFLSF